MSARPVGNFPRTRVTEKFRMRAPLHNINGMQRRMFFQPCFVPTHAHVVTSRGSHARLFFSSSVRWSAPTYIYYVLLNSMSTARCAMCEAVEFLSRPTDNVIMTYAFREDADISQLGCVSIVWCFRFPVIGQTTWFNRELPFGAPLSQNPATILWLCN